MFRDIPIGLIALGTIIAVSSPLSAQAPTHPLDALTASEYWTIFDVMKASGRMDTLSGFAGVNLKKPAKAVVLAWEPGQPFGREANVVVKRGSAVFEAVVDIAAERVESWTPVPGAQPNLSDSDWESMDDLIKANPEWREAMRRRGVTDYTTLSCGAGILGYFDTPEEQGRRLGRGVCWDRHGTWTGQANPVEGVMVLVDMDTKEVLRVVDTGAIPVPRASADHDRAAIGRSRPVSSPIFVQQPQGPGYQLDGTQVMWQNWKFHFKVDPRMGVIIDHVRYHDGERDRSVLYEGALTEIFVPYQNPSEGWYYITFLDVGELSYGLATPLERGTDCPDHASFFDGVYADEDGMPFQMPNTACLFEREAGDVAWRHWDDGKIESRARRDLVLRMIATIGNYDYLVDWVFRQDGTIKVVAGATGMVNVQAASAATALATDNGSDNGDRAGVAAADAYGHFVDRNVVAVNHDHFLSFRLDLDVDGPTNSFVVDRLTLERLPDAHPRKTIWRLQPEILASESEGRLTIRLDKPALWRVFNPDVVGPLGYPVSFHIKPGGTAISLLADDDNPQIRGGFSKYSLWVTQYQPDEQLATGDYVTGSKTAAGLPAWTKANRSIQNTDIVVWYTMGMHHVPRSEDWPVMPTALYEFELRPFDFFTRNPALDLPRR